MKNRLRDEASKRCRLRTLALASQNWPDWVAFVSHAKRIAAFQLAKDGLLDRKRDTYYNRYLYRWIPGKNA